MFNRRDDEILFYARRKAWERDIRAIFSFILNKNALGGADADAQFALAQLIRIIAGLTCLYISVTIIYHAAGEREELYRSLRNILRKIAVSNKDR